MTTIPGWVYVLAAGLAVIMLAVASDADTKPKVRRIAVVVAAALGGVLVLLSLLLAAAT